MIVVVVRAVLVVAGGHVLHVFPGVMHVCHVSHRVLLLLLCHQPLEPLAQPVLILHLSRTCDRCKFLHHAVSPVGPLDGVSCIVCSIKAAISAAQHLQLLVQEILGELVRLGHLRPAETLSAGLLGDQLVPVLPHAAAPLCPGDSASSADNRVKSEVSE